MGSSYELSPEELSERERKRRLVFEFWTDLYNEGDAGAATWEALDRLRDKVTAALSRRPPNVGLAESLTAKAAMMMISGQGY
jgi:hypothetical protein